MNSWGPFNDEDEFNLWLRGDGEPLLLNELRTFFGFDFNRIDVRNTIFGQADHYFLYNDHGRLLIIESAEKLYKEHLAKDFLYLFEDIAEYKIKSTTLFWILLHRPSAEIIESIHAIHELALIGTSRPQFHISTITNIGSSNLRINIEASFGDRMVSINGRDFLADCINNEKYFSVKSISKILGLPYTSTFNTLRRWCAEYAKGKVSLTAINEMIANIEQKATTDTGINFIGKYIPITAKSDDMLFPAELNRVLGKKGYAVRDKIKAKWITIFGSANIGYRLLYDVRDFDTKKRTNNSL